MCWSSLLIQFVILGEHQEPLHPESWWEGQTACDLNQSGNIYLNISLNFRTIWTVSVLNALKNLMFFLLIIQLKEHFFNWSKVSVMEYMNAYDHLLKSQDYFKYDEEEYVESMQVG